MLGERKGEEGGEGGERRSRAPGGLASSARMSGGRSDIWEDVHAAAAFLITSHATFATLAAVLRKRKEALPGLADGDVLATLVTRVAAVIKTGCPYLPPSR